MRRLLEGRAYSDLCVNGVAFIRSWHLFEAVWHFLENVQYILLKGKIFLLNCSAFKFHIVLFAINKGINDFEG